MRLSGLALACSACACASVQAFHSPSRAGLTRRSTCSLVMIEPFDPSTAVLVAESYGAQVSSLREQLTSVLPTMEQFDQLIPDPPSFAGAVSDLRDVLNVAFVQFRFLALVLTFGSLLFAVLLGAVAGDPIAAGDERDRPRKILAGEPLGEDFVFLAQMTPEQASAFDEGFGGRAAKDSAAQELMLPEAMPRRGLSAGVWLELVICFALDVGGCASYFYPNLGEVSDAGYAIVYAFAIETLFGWPELAIFGFWEEVLPLTDVVPTATLAWILVVLGLGPKGAAAKQRVRPSPSDIRAYQTPDPHLQPGNRLWED